MIGLIMEGWVVSKLDDICYRMYENSGNSKYIRVEWAGKPFHPDEAKEQIKALFKELISGQPKQFGYWGDEEAQDYAEFMTELSKKVDEL